MSDSVLQSDVEQGFTIVEMIVSVSIIAIISSIAVFNHQQFSDMVKLANETQSIALALRTAQVEGLAVREFSRSGDADFESGRGVYISVDSDNRYVYFADKNQDKQYNGSTSSCSGECISITALEPRFRIVDLCGKVSGPAGDWLCTADGDLSDRSIHISYLRPRPGALFFSSDGSGGNILQDSPRARIEVESPEGKKAWIEIKQTGEISTRNTFFD